LTSQRKQEKNVKISSSDQWNVWIRNNLMIMRRAREKPRLGYEVRCFMKSQCHHQSGLNINAIGERSEFQNESTGQKSEMIENCLFVQKVAMQTTDTSFENCLKCLRINE
jgi:hypothetical protein